MDQDIPDYPNSLLCPTVPTLRDTFAAAALTGILANQATTGTASVVIERVARLAYDVADAMMTERLKQT